MIQQLQDSRAFQFQIIFCDEEKLITVSNELFTDYISFRSALQSMPEVNGEKWKKVGGNPTQINLQDFIILNQACSQVVETYLEK